MPTVTKNKTVDYLKSKKGSLSEIFPFNTIPAAPLLEIEKNTIVKNYARREYIFMEDDSPNYVWFVKEGHVKIAHFSMEGRSQTIALKGPMGMFGVAAFGESEYGVYAMAETEASVIAVPNQVFQVLLDRYPAFAKAMVGHMSKLLRQAKEMEAISVSRAEKRLLHALIEMAGEYGTTIPLTRREIAEMAGTSVETCIRTFSHLDGTGLMSSAHGKLTINSVESLRSRMEEL